MITDSDEDIKREASNVLADKPDEEVLQDHLLLNSMDLFLFLNTNNDQYLKEEDINSLLTYGQD